MLMLFICVNKICWAIKSVYAIVVGHKFANEENDL